MRHHFQRCPLPLPDWKPAEPLPVIPGRPRNWPQILIPWGYSGWIRVGPLGRLYFVRDHFNEIQQSLEPILERLGLLTIE